MVNAVISEFNPFHNGHKYLLSQAKQKTGAQYTVCFMSGDFVQRGEMAFADKHTRAAAAVKHGADIVFQLPTAHVVAGASVFGDAGVYCAASLGVDTHLCFGSESEDISGLFALADVDRKLLSTALKEEIKSGKSVAQAMTDAYFALGADAELLKTPNNLLAFEYIKAAKEQKAELDIVNIVRKGVCHDGDKPTGEFASASYIRKNSSGDMSAFMPEKMMCETDKARFDSLLLYSILSKTPDELVKFADISEGLENKFAECAKKAKTPDELYMAVKSKRYTHAKIRRAALSVLLQNPKGLYKRKVPYLKVLAFNDNGRQLLKILSDSAKIPIVTKASEGEKLHKEHFALECRASDLFDFCRHKQAGREYTMSPVYVR